MFIRNRCPSLLDVDKLENPNFQQINKSNSNNGLSSDDESERSRITR